MALSPREKLAAAAIRVSDSVLGMAPYFGVMLLGLIRKETPEIPTLAVSKHGVLYWNPGFVEKTPVETLAYALQHEVMHVVLKHHERAEALGIVIQPGQQVSAELQRKADLANLAEDACINENLRGIVNAHCAAGKIVKPLPDEWIYPETLQQDEKLTFEQRYARLLREPPKCTQPKPGLGAGKCGSCAGNPTDGEPAEPADGKGGRSVAEMDRYRRQTAEAVQEHARRKGLGAVPAGLQRWADEILAPPKVDWRKHLAMEVRAAVAYKAGAVDVSWSRVSRRQSGCGWGIGRPVVPAYRAPIPQVAVILDTSGSMSAADLASACAELGGVLKATGAAVTFAVCDAAVHGIQTVATLAAAMAMLAGGGGTNMCPAFAALAARRDRADVIIVLTDGEIGSGHPDEAPRGSKVVWCVVGEFDGAPAPWGAVVRVEAEKETS